MLGANFKLAIGSLLAARARTILTTVGITIGVASILLVFAAGAGAREKATENLDALPKDTSLLSSGTGAPGASSPFEPTAMRSASVFTERDLGSLRDASLTSKVAPIMEIAGPVAYRDKVEQSAFIGGTTQDLFPLLGSTYVDGSSFDNAETSSVVLGNNVAESLFGTELASGKTLTIRGDTYTVVGVLGISQLPLEVTGVPINDTVFMPYSQAKAYTDGFAQFSRVFVQADSSKFDRITTLLTRNHNNQKDFSIGQASDTAINSPLLSVLVSVTAVTAGLSLIIGGIGIMNIMLVNVSERTREIGIRKSIGASDGIILIQFLIEAIVMSLAGGILGTLLGLAVAVIGGLFLPFGLLFTPGAIVTVLGVSFLIGIIFGLIPAIRASRKDTIEALRYYQ